MPTLLFLHGWGGNADSFAPVVKYFAAQGYQTLTPSLPCPPAEVYTLADYVRVVQDFLAQHQVTQCDVIAHSFGARLVALLHADQPHLFRKIVITGGAGLPPRFSLRVWLKIWGYKLRKKLGLRADGGSADYRQLDTNGKITFQNIIHQDLTAEIKRLSAAMLLIHGSKDTATPLSMAKRWVRLAPHAKLLVYRQHGHFAYLECTARFIKDVEAFLDA